MEFAFLCVRIIHNFYHNLLNFIHAIFCYIYLNRKMQSDYFYSEEGFHRILLKNDDTININFCNGSFSLFFFIPYHPDFKIQKIIIDGKTVEFFQCRELAIEGKSNATLTFSSNISNLYIQADFWIIPSNHCINPTVFLYGGNELEFKISLCNQLCIFSPSFDSKNKKFEIEFGAISQFREHSSFLYSKSVKTADVKKYLNEINKYYVDEAFFIQFHSNYSKYNSNDFYFYSRKSEMNNKKRIFRKFLSNGLHLKM